MINITTINLRYPNFALIFKTVKMTKQEMTMITQMVKFNIRAEHYKLFKTALFEDRKNARQEAGYVEMRFFAHKTQPNIIFCYERWKDQDAQDFHREHPYTVKICSLVDIALQSPIEIMEGKIKDTKDSLTEIG